LTESDGKSEKNELKRTIGKAEKKARRFSLISAGSHSLTSLVLQILYWSIAKTEFSE